MALFESKKELRKLKKISQQLSPEKQKICASLIADLAFMAEQLEILRADIQENGWDEEYQNGANQHGRKKRVEADAYITLQKNYQSSFKALCDLLPETAGQNDELMDFIRA